MSDDKRAQALLVELVGKKKYLLFICACFWISLFLLGINHIIPFDLNILIILSYFMLVSGGIFAIFRVCLYFVKKLATE